MGDNSKVDLAKFSTLSWSVLLNRNMSVCGTHGLFYGWKLRQGLVLLAEVCPWLCLKCSPVTNTLAYWADKGRCTTWCLDFLINPWHFWKTLKRQWSSTFSLNYGVRFFIGLSFKPSDFLLESELIQRETLAQCY
jgi:hypothetical protein